MEKKMKIDLTCIHNDYNHWSGETVTLIHNNKGISGKVIKTEKNDYHIIVTTDNKVVSVDWNENSDEINNYIFNDYDFTTKHKVAQ
jgi:hypothetical protein